MGNPISNIPILLFPLKLETRFVQDELWIRVFPDEAFIQSHDPTLSQEEIADAVAFKEHTATDLKKQAWEKLVAKYGVYRSSWIVHISSEELERQSSEDVKVEEPSFHFKWLPDRLVFYVYRKGDQNPAYEADGSVIDRDGLSILGEGDAWLQDFDKALEAGMGVKIKIDPAHTKFEKVIVSGFRYDEDPTDPAKGLADLFDNHQYTQGFSFLNYGTPTNNTGNVKSGHTAKDEFEVADSFTYAVEGLILERDDEVSSVPHIHFLTHGRHLGRSLGFESNQLRHVRHADETLPLLNELFQKASWFALGAQPLFMLLGNQIGSETHESIWHHYSKYVKARGSYPALKIGNQPYGILPAMNISNVLLPENRDILESDKLYDKIHVILARMMKRWLSMAMGGQAGLPRLTGNDSPEDILKVLGMQEYSVAYQIRALEYRSFKSHLYEFAGKSPRTVSSWGELDGLGHELESIHENINSLAGLFDLNEQVISGQIDQFLRAPLLSFKDANAQVIGFDQGSSNIPDDERKPIANGKTGKDSFLFAEDDLEHFQGFIEAIKSQEPGELVQYRSNLSLFSDLFVRSYINACQLYFREIVFEPQIPEASGSQKFTIIAIEKTENAQVAKGDTVLAIEDEDSNHFSIEAPFAGSIKNMHLKVNETTSPGRPLFTLQNKSKYKAIKDEFINLGQRLIDTIQALPEGEDRIKAQKKAIGEVVDLNSYRLDAWITSLAARRIEEMRNKPDYRKGIYFGAYGWIEDLEKDTTPVNPETLTDIYRDAGGIIHNPGVAQVVTSSVFKNSFLAHQDEGESNPFTINLSSDRLQKSYSLLEGIRQGQSLEALLGYQLERHLHENQLDQEIYKLRKAFPLYENTNENLTGFVNLTVIDGLKAIRNKDTLPPGISSKVQVMKQIEKLEDTLDGSLDTLFYESGYQVTQGNLGQAAAVIEATKGENVPPEIESLKTKRPGTGITHKLIMVIQPNPELFTMENPRAFVEPNLETWLKNNLGPMEDMTCQVEFYNTRDDSLISTTEVSVGELGIGYLDLLYLCDDTVSDGAGELELRIRNAVWERMTEPPEDARYIITDPGQVQGLSLMKVLEVIRNTKALLTRCRQLKSKDLKMENELTPNNVNILREILDKRLVPIADRLKELTDSDLDQKPTLKWLSNLDFESVKTTYLTGTPIDSNELKIKIESKVKAMEDLISKFNPQDPFDKSFELLEQIAKLLFGDAFILLPSARLSDTFSRIFSGQKQKFLIGDPSDNETEQVWGQKRVENWMQGVAQVQENSELFEDWLMVQRVWNQTTGMKNNDHYSVVQGPTLTQYPWVALSKQEIDLLLEKEYTAQPAYTDPISGEPYPLSDGTYYPDGCDSTVIYGPKNLTLEEPVFGWVIEEFAEHIPDQKMNTGLSFNYNAPDNEPPQAILLAVHPKAAQESEFFWSEDDLRDILYDTMDLYKIRMVDLEAIQEYGYLLPMTYWFHIPQHK